MPNNGAISRVADGTLTDTTNSDTFQLGPQDRIASVQATWDVTTPTTATFVPGTLEVQTVTFPSAATAEDGDYVVVEDYAGAKWAVALSKSGAEVQTLTFLAKASCVAGDFMIFYDTSARQWAVSVNKSGTDVAPTAEGYLAIPAARRAHVNISSATTAAQVAALYETAMNALTGFSTAFTTDDSAADGTMLLTSDATGPVSAPTSHKKDAGSGNSAGPGVSIVGESTTTGYTTAEPTGAIWSAIDAANKGIVDLTSATDAASVAALAELAFDALVGFTVVTDDTAADGTMTFTQAEPGATVNPVVKNADDSGAGTITGVQSTGGVGGVNVSSNAVYHAAHGLATGCKGRLTTATTLPAGLALSTDYWVIRVDANNFKFASTLAHAQDGTTINITDRGTGTHTFTPTALSASIKLQRSVDNSNWVDLLDAEMVSGITNSQTISADGSYIWLIPAAYWPYLRTRTTIAAGQLTLVAAAYSK